MYFITKEFFIPIKFTGRTTRLFDFKFAQKDHHKPGILTHKNKIRI